ncbi:hypothetical protein M8J76_013340 [Diaphorina citri]|nr:hypothetical protein M8J76_013340 [Diaphorina citri]KAI5752524.1 hypothetical protein M8J77_017799 [Diaphorina citri]
MESSHYAWAVMAIVVTSTVESANILAIFPTASYSHQMPLLAVAKRLAERGHNLTVITPNPTKEPIPNYTDIDISFTYAFWTPQGDKKPVVNLQQRIGAFEMIGMFTQIAYTVVDLQLNSTPIQNFIKYVDREKPKFDLVIYEELMHTSFLALLPKIGHPPLVAMLTLALPCSIDFTFGNVCNPSYVPDLMIGFTNKMTFLERLQNYVFIFFMHFYMNRVVIQGQNELAKKYFNHTGKPTIQEMARNKSILLLTNSWLYQYPRPVFPNTINVGPTHIGDTKPLPEDLATWIEGAEKGVIYFSLGSNMRSASLEESKRSAILTTFAKFPQYRVIWKWEEEQLPGLPSNVICRKWLPQHDLLAHPKIKLFITQGGLQSLQEAVYFEVPLIGIPFFGDQDYNVKIIKNLGIGTYMDFDSVSTEVLYNLMKEILYNTSYMDTVKRVSALSKTQMMSPRDTAVWWIEYVLKSGGNLRHLQPDHWDMPWYQYFGLDVFLVLLSPVILVLYGIYKIISRCKRKSSGEKLKKS